MKRYFRLLTTLNLHLFDGAPAAAPAAPAAAAPASTEGNAEGGEAVKPDSPEARKAAFEKFKTEYKDLYGADVSEHVNRRVKDHSELQARLKSLDPTLEVLYTKYGVDKTASNAIELLNKAIEEDDSYYEAEALEKGWTVQQLKDFKKTERENARLNAMLQQQNDEKARAELWGRLQKEGEAVKQQFPNFDLNAELTSNVRLDPSGPTVGERYAAMVRAGVDLMSAFKIIHESEIIGGAMAYTAQTVAKKMASGIAANGMRPSENGASGSNPAAVGGKGIPKTKAERDALSLRAIQGANVSFGN